MNFRDDTQHHDQSGPIETMDADQLVGVLREQQVMVQELNDLADQQRSLIQSHKADELLELIGRRQSLVDRIMSNQHVFTVFAEQAKAGTVPAPSHVRATMQTLMRDIGAALERILELDQADQDLLADQRDGRRRELSVLETSRTARLAYTRQHRVDNRFADKKG